MLTQSVSLRLLSQNGGGYNEYSASDEVKSINYEFVNNRVDFLGAEIETVNATDSLESFSSISLVEIFNLTLPIMAGYEQWHSIWQPFSKDYQKDSMVICPLFILFRNSDGNMVTTALMEKVTTARDPLYNLSMIGSILKLLLRTQRFV
jgi:hypothetical protein